MVDRDRVAILWVPYAELAGLLTGKYRVVGLPDDAVISGVGSDFRKKSIGLRVLSNSFRKIAPGERVGSLFFDTIPFKTEPIHSDAESVVLKRIESLQDGVIEKAKKSLRGDAELLNGLQQLRADLREAKASRGVPLQEVGA